MAPNELLALRADFWTRKRKPPTEAYMHADDILDIVGALMLPESRVFGMRLIIAEQERGKPLLTHSRDVS